MNVLTKASNLVRAEGDPRVIRAGHSSLAVHHQNGSLLHAVLRVRERHGDGALMADIPSKLQHLDSFDRLVRRVPDIRGRGQRGSVVHEHNASAQAGAGQCQVELRQ